MAWRRVSAEQVEAALEALVARHPMKAAAKAAQVTESTFARWCVAGAPVAGAGIPAGTPLLVLAHRRQSGEPTDALISDAEQLALMRIAAKHLLLVTDQFLKAFGDAEVR